MSRLWSNPIYPIAEKRFFSDLDFEYPSDSSQGSGFASLITQLRTGLDQLAANKGDKVPYQITVSKQAKEDFLFTSISFRLLYLLVMKIMLYVESVFEDSYQLSYRIS